MSETKSEYHPVIENTFETEGENQGRVKNTELNQGLASIANDVYDKQVEEGRYSKEQFDGEVDEHLRRGLARVAIAVEHPQLGSMNTYVASGLASEGKTHPSHEAAIATANEVIEQYDSLKQQ